MKLIALLFFILATKPVYCTLGCKTQAELMSDLRSNSTTNVFPVLDRNAAITASVAFDFLHLMHVDILQQQVTTRVWVALMFRNEFVFWDPDNYCGVDHLLSSGDSGLLWYPDIILLESASNLEIFQSGSAQMRIKSDGSTMICRYATVDITCDMNSWKFPYDEHECILTLKADADSTKKLILEAAPPSGRMYMEGDVWNILSYGLQSTEGTLYLNETYSTLRYSLKFQRAGNFIFTIIAFPGTMINTLCVSAYALPVSSGEKVGLTVTLFLAQAVNLMLFAEYLPPGGNSVPLVAQYLVLSIVMTAMSVLCAVYESRKATYGEKERECEQSGTGSEEKSERINSGFSNSNVETSRVEFMLRGRSAGSKVTPMGNGEVSEVRLIGSEKRTPGWLALVARKLSVTCSCQGQRRSDIMGVMFAVVTVGSTSIYMLVLFLY